MTSKDDLQRLDAIEKALLNRWPETRIAPTLDRIAALADALGSPQLSYPTIHIAGTNGKTTTTRLITLFVLNWVCALEGLLVRI